MAAGLQPISVDERRQRLNALRMKMDKAGVAGVLLGSTSSLRYFTGVIWHPSERFLGALITADRIDYIGPAFERTKVESLISVPGELFTWEEEENPYRLIADRAAGATFALDGDLPLFMYRALRREIADEQLADAVPLIAPLRARKSPAEIALLQHAKAITLETQRRARDFLEEGVMASDVARFIDETHRALGGSSSTFCIVAFGADTSLPHGPEKDRALKGGDAVLIDTGCEVEGYNSDITRSYVYGDPTPRYREAWEAEKEAQGAAFEAARRGALCESVRSEEHSLNSSHVRLSRMPSSA